MNVFQQWYEAGYHDLLPVVPPNAKCKPTSHVAAGRGKSPGIRDRNSGLWTGLMGWNNIQPTQADLDEWHAMGASTGLRLGKAWMLDLDIYDADTAAAVEAKAIEMLGPAPMRVGQWPKRSLLYACNGDIKAQKMHFAGKQGEVNNIEIPPQSVIAGIHAKTGKPYEWRRKLLKIDQLTVVTPDALASFLKAMRVMLPAASSVSGASEATVNQTALVGDADVIAEIMAKLPNNADMRWDFMVTLGYALRAALPDAQELAFDLWDDWCSRWKDEGYDQTVARVRWDSFKGPYRVGADWLYDLGDQLLGKTNEFKAKAFIGPIENSDEPESPFTRSSDEKAQQNDDVYDVVDLPSLMSRPPPKMLIARHIPEQSVGFVYGEPGSYKSFLALDMSLSIAAGDAEWHGDTIQAAPDAIVLYLAAEGSFGFRNRIKAWLKRRNKALDDGLSRRFKMIERTINFMEPGDIQKLMRTVRRVVGARPCLIIVDTVSRALPGADENLQKDMTLFVHACDALKDAFACAVIGVHHAGKSGDMRGSTVLRGAGDFVFRMTRRPKSQVVTLACEKQKDAPSDWEDVYLVENVALDGEETSLVLGRSDLGVGPASDMTPDLAVRVLEAMRAAWDTGSPWTMTHQGKERFAVRQLISGFGLKPDVAESTLRLWEATGLIRTETVSSRDKKRGLKVVGDIGQLVQQDGIFS